MNSHIQHLARQVISQNYGFFIPEDTEPLPASNEFIDSIPSYIHTSTDSQTGCSICLELLNDGDEITSLSCDHVFHKTCLVTWLRRSNACPLCRTQVDTSNDTNVQQVHFVLAHERERELEVRFELGNEMVLNTRWCLNTKICELLQYVSHFSTHYHFSECEISFSTPSRTYTFKTTESYNSLNRSLSELIPINQRIITCSIGQS